MIHSTRDALHARQMEEAVARLTCPRCSAAPGMECRTPSGVRTEVHTGRIRGYKHRALTTVARYALLVDKPHLGLFPGDVVHVVVSYYSPDHLTLIPGINDSTNFRGRDLHHEELRFLNFTAMTYNWVTETIQDAQG